MKKHEVIMSSKIKTMINRLLNPLPKRKDVDVIKPYYLDYDGTVGFAQVMRDVEKKHVGILVKDAEGNPFTRVMKVTDRESFSDFGGTCTGLHFKRTRFEIKP